MNRRSFNATSLAALLVPLPQVSFAQHKNLGALGYQVAELNDGRFTRRHGGLAKPHTAVDDHTVFQVASCSKTVTALAILTLVRDGHIELDQPANRYLKGWQLPGPRGADATISELMSHTAGTTVHGFDGYKADDDLPNLHQILAGGHPANSKPVRTRRRLFSRFNYSGGGTLVLQRVIEDVTGTDFASYTTAEVLQKIGAPRATFAIEPAGVFAHGYYVNGEPLVGGYKRHPESAAAGLWATASDLVKVLQSILLSLDGAPNAIIPTELAQRMVTPVSQESGLGIFVDPNGAISHDGRNHGFDSVMVAELGTGRIRAAVTNRNGAIETQVGNFFSD